MPPVPQTMRLIDPDGITRDVSLDAAPGLLQDPRWRVPTDEDAASRLSEQAREQSYGGVGGGIKAGVAAFARGASLGGTDVVARALGGDDAAIELEGLREAHPYVSGGAEFLGALAPAIASGGATAPESAAMGAAEGVGALARASSVLPAAAAARAGGAVARASEGVLGRIGGAALGGAAEGALYGAGQGVSEVALSGNPLDVEHVASAIGSNTLYGAGLGAGLGGLGKAAELGLARAKGTIDAALEKRALSKAKTPIEAIETGDLQTIDKKILDTAEKTELERLHAEQAPQRKALTDELDTWRRSNRDEHDLREIAKASIDPDLREAGGAFDRANLKLRSALDDRVGFAEDPARSMKVVRAQGQALEEMKAAALEQQRMWQEELAAAPAQIRSALDEVAALGAAPGVEPEFVVGNTPMKLTTETKSVIKGGPKKTTVTVTRTLSDGEEVPVATAEFTHRKTELYPEHITVEDQFRRQGIATRVYDAAEAATGKRIIPSETPTPLDKAFQGQYKSKEPPAPLTGEALLKARKRLAERLGLGSEIGPFTEAGREAAAERVLKERMGYHWHGDGGAVKGGLREPSIVKRLSKIDEMIAANQKLQGQLAALTEPPTSDLLTKIADARAVIEGPKAAPSGLETAVSAVAPFAGPFGAAAAAGGRVIGSFRKLAAAAGERVARAASKFLGGAQKTAAVATPLAPILATKVLAAVRYADDDGKRTPAGGKTLPDLYEARASEVRSQVQIAPDGSHQMRPEARAKMAAKFDGIRPSDPVLADQLEELSARRLEYLASIMPRLPDYAAMPGVAQPRISDMAMRSWARSAAALEDPHGVLERATSGHVTLEDAAAIRNVYPELLHDFLGQVGARERKGPLPFKQRLALSILSGEPHDPALTPHVLAVLQGSFTNDAGVPATQAPQAMPAFGSVKRSIPDPTPSQRRAQGQTEA